MDELKGYAVEPMFYFGLVAAFLDGLVIAQAWDWLVSGHRLSIWLLM